MSEHEKDGHGQGHGKVKAKILEIAYEITERYGEDIESSEEFINEMMSNFKKIKGQLVEIMHEMHGQHKKE